MVCHLVRIRCHCPSMKWQGFLLLFWELLLLLLLLSRCSKTESGKWETGQYRKRKIRYLFHLRIFCGYRIEPVIILFFYRSDGKWVSSFSLVSATGDRENRTLGKWRGNGACMFGGAAAFSKRKLCIQLALRARHGSKVNHPILAASCV